MQTRFGEMNKNIVERIDTMGSKIDDLETSIKELVQEANEANPNQKWADKNEPDLQIYGFDCCVAMKHLNSLLHFSNSGL